MIESRAKSGYDLYINLESYILYLNTNLTFGAKMGYFGHFSDILEIFCQYTLKMTNNIIFGHFDK